VVYCKLMGTGVADVAAARFILERAEQLGLGVEMDF
jgi:ornithine cyclodeaminase/alanine dehydrogenase-like protein (mu-crystallin family)